MLWSLQHKVVLVELCEKHGTGSRSFDEVASSLNKYISRTVSSGMKSVDANDCRLQLKALEGQFGLMGAQNALPILKQKLSDLRLQELEEEIDAVVREYNQTKADLELVMSGKASAEQLMCLSNKFDTLSTDGVSVESELTEDEDEINVSGLIQELAASDDSDFLLDCSLSAATDDTLTENSNLVDEVVTPSVTSKVESPAAAVVTAVEKECVKKKENVLKATADQEPTAEVEDKSYRQWKRSTLLLWKIISNHKWANIFMHPVTDDIAPNYSKVINNPIDLTTIKKNIENGTIRTNEQLTRDLLLMFQNALIYNNTDHKIYKFALEMQNDCLISLQQSFGASFFGKYQIDVPQDIRQPRTRTGKFV